LRENELLVHYNGWSSHWDEWMSADSPKIALFRTHTVQPINSIQMSPLPVNLVDGEQTHI